MPDRECDSEGCEREALFRLFTDPPCRCFECVADDPSLPPGYLYKQAIERPLETPMG